MLQKKLSKQQFLLPPAAINDSRTVVWAGEEMIFLTSNAQLNLAYIAKPKKYLVTHNLWQFPGNWLQIANYGRFSNFKALFEMPCLFTSRKVQKITHSAQKRVFKLLFSKQPKILLARIF